MRTPTGGTGRPVDLRMPLLGAAAWAGALLGRAGAAHRPEVVPGPALLVLGGLTGVALVAAVVLVARRRASGPGSGSPAAPGVAATAAGLVLVAVSVGAVAAVRVDAVVDGPVAAVAGERPVVALRARVASDPRPVPSRFGDRVAVRLVADRLVARGRVIRTRAPVLLLGEPAWREAALGARVELRGRLLPADDPDLAALVVSPSRPDVRADPGPAWRGAAAVRASVRDAVAERPPAQAALVPALVDGDDAGLDPGLAEDFRVTGLTHLTAVSGTNLTLVVGFLLALARWVGVRGRWLLVVGGLGVVGFVLLARTEPSVLRAAAMGTVGLVALGVGGRDRALRALGLATVVLLLVSPGLAASVGFVLSVLATAGIVLLGPGLRDALAAWAPRWVAEAVAVPTAAQLACTPVVAAISGQVSLVAVGCNLLVAPAVGPATVLGLLGGLVGLVHDAASRLVGAPAGWCVAWVVAVARRGAALPLPAVPWGTGAVAVGGLVVLTVLVALGTPWLLRRRGRALALVAVLAVAVLAPGRTPGLPGLPGWAGVGAGWGTAWPPPGWALVLCDVGQGDAVVLNAGPGYAVVVDAGPEPALVDGCLARLHVEAVPLVVLTHFHADHVDGLPGVLDGRAGGAVLTTRVLDPPGGVDAVTDAVREVDGLRATPAPWGETLRVGAVTLQVLGPAAGPTVAGAGDGSSANDASVVLLAEVGGVRTLLTGDVEPPGQARLAAALGDLDVDVLKVPHHGSRYQDLDWLTGLRAERALVPVGADNDYGHPAPATLDALTAAGARVHRTDTEGDLAVVRGGTGVRVVARG